MAGTQQPYWSTSVYGSMASQQHPTPCGRYRDRSHPAHIMYTPRRHQAIGAARKP
ncbi:hypothetical protein I545_5948 [Mycobacterium kansasii 662]|uniref:Uncharacterized protein n=1 Tax=Mycobacterium kansasii 662 TaxID=1299326 RepID=X7YTD8_MYCKA|nr:hypothetical protein I545_5948 [Mycobacterium kansasii 662]